ncbi:MAG: hypothetical protein KKA07_03735 [Bacteroidetes bacterium]|nr:hypothetical protein [Bacteroidota bacterium]
MKIQTQQEVDPKDLQDKLVAKFPQYQFNFRTKKLLIAKKNSTTGVNILIRRSAVVANASFPSMGANMLFTLSIVGLGVLIPLILWLAIFYKGQKAMEKEIGGFIMETYGAAR